MMNTLTVMRALSRESRSSPIWEQDAELKSQDNYSSSTQKTLHTERHGGKKCIKVVKKLYLGEKNEM